MTGEEESSSSYESPNTSRRMVEIVRRLSITLGNFKKREVWSGRYDFLLSCIGYAVGLGTIWRFPYVCYRNGGGAFLIPYVIYMVLLGMPLVILEMGFGQLGALSPISIWKMSPLFKGVGLGMVIISGITCIYYNVIIAWTLFYISQSFQWELPWKHCNNPWNTPKCVTRWIDRNSSITSWNDTSSQGTWDNATQSFTTATPIMTNITGRKTASEEFWSQRVLKLSAGIDQPGQLQWELAICLVVAWIFIFCCLCRGIKTSGKVVYVTATLPYVLLITFIIKGLTMDGASIGIRYYMVPDWSKLLTFQPWAEAAQQMFYSMGAAWGAWITMASYNKYHNNFYRDAVITSLIDTLTAFLSGFVIFSTIGYMSKQTGLSVKDVVTSGPGLVFVVMPEAISAMPFAPFWAILFFIFIFFVGVDSQFGMFETVLSGIYDEFPSLTKHKISFTALLCVFELLMGLACITQGGVYIFQIMDWYCSTFSLMIISFFECVAIGHVYKASRFYEDMTFMLGWSPPRWWSFCWRFITPTLIFCLFLTNLAMHKPVSYGKYEYPIWAIGLGILLSLCSIVPIPLMAIYKISRQKGTIFEKIKKAARPSDDWNPHKNRTVKLEETAGKVAPMELSVKEDELDTHVTQSEASHQLARASVVSMVLMHVFTESGNFGFLRIVRSIEI